MNLEPLRRWLSPLLIVIATGLLGSSAVAAVPGEFDTNPGAERSPRAVDLRFVERDGRRVRVIPEPRQQHGNSCVGWAVAFAAKTYQESVDQGWLPDHPSRQFSPSFVYNLVNGARDEGGSTRAALQVIVDRGCATLATMPIDGDPARRPSAEAFEEAARFRASGYRSLSSGREIKEALASGQVVVLVVRTHPLFIAGGFSGYDRELDRKGLRQLAPGAPHSTHSMCVVGYDDDRNAFLLMNSWGTDWREGDGAYAGMAWVDYDLMREVAPRDDLFAREAYVLIDERQRVGERPISSIPRGELSLGLSDRYHGRGGGKRFWEWTVYLDGDAEIRAHVAEVTYHLHPSFPTPDRTEIRTSDLRFAHTTKGWGTFPLRATVLFRDGTSRQLSTHLRFTSPPTD